MVSKVITPADAGELDFDRDLGEGWEVAETDIGDKIEWSDEPKFYGVYKGREVVTTTDQKTGELVEIEVHLFKDTAGEARFAWHSPRLDRGLSKAPIGSEVAIRWDGKENLSGGRTMNLFTVMIKAPAI